MSSLSCKSSGAFGVQVESGAFIESATIMDVGVLTDTQPENFKKPIGLGINLVLQKEGLSFNPEIKIFGDPKLDEDGEIIGWGSAFPVRDVLNKIGGFEGDLGDGDDPKGIPAKVLLSLVGKTVFYLRYVYSRAEDGKLKYSTWRQVSSSEEDLVKQWKKSRALGYPRDYNPTLLQGNGDHVVVQPVEGEEF